MIGQTVCWFVTVQVIFSVSVDSCVPGDIVTVTGVVKVNSVDEGKYYTDKELYKHSLEETFSYLLET